MSYRVTLQTGRTVTADRVTHVIRRGMPSPFLERWKLREAVRYALTNPPMTVGDDDLDAVIKAWASDSLRHSRRGTNIHRLIAHWLTEPVVGVEVPEEFAGYWHAFLTWMGGKHGKSLPSGDLRIEQTLLDTSCSVAGTADLIAGDVLVDWKTSEKHWSGPPWPDHIAQVGAYSSMKWTVDTRTVSGPAPQIKRAMIVRLCADGTSHTTVLESPDLMAARSLWRHVREVARHVQEVPE